MAGSIEKLDGATVAFRRLLAETGRDHQARVDALLAMSQRPVWVVDWPGRGGCRTLTNGHLETALPVFTGLDTLEQAAGRLGWGTSSVSLHKRKIPARDALRHALARGVHFLVLDLGASHTMEFSSAEIEPLLSVPSGTAGAGPYLGDRDSEQSLWTAVRRSSRPPAGGRGSFMPPAPDGLQAARKDDLHSDLRPSSVVEAGATAGGAPGGRGPEIAPQAPLPPEREETGVQETHPGIGPDDWEMPSGRHPIAGRGLGGAEPDIDADRHDRDARVPDVHTKQTLVGGPAPADLVAASNHEAVTREHPLPGKSARAAYVEPAVTGEHPTLRGSDIRALHALDAQVLDAIATVLRGFPEVEWASATFEPERGHCVGVRVDPSFTSRLTSISDAITQVAGQWNAEVSVVILVSRQEVMLAQHEWEAFYPWRRRAAAH